MLVPLIVALAPFVTPQEASPLPGKGDLQVAARVVGLTFTDAEAELALEGVRENLESYERLWGIEVDNSVAPVLSLSAAMQGRSRGCRAGPRSRRRRACCPM